MYAPISGYLYKPHVPISGYLYLRLEHVGKYADQQHQYDSRVVRSAVSRGEYSVVNERA